MKNVLKYYYNLYPTEIHQINKRYKFNLKNNSFIFEPFTRNIDELSNIYNLQEYLFGIGFHNSRVVLNVNHEMLTNVNGINYVLFQVFVKNEIIQVNDVLVFSGLKIFGNNFDLIRRDNWYNLWIDKIDYVEYQISQFGKKYELIRYSSDYYIGIVENCISLLANIVNGKSVLTVSHNRTSMGTNLVDYYDPLCFIIDNRVRDMAEYIKDCMQKQINILDIIDIVKKYIYYNNLNLYEINLFFIRIMYPSYYLDACEKILEGKVNQEKLRLIVDNSQLMEDNLKTIYGVLRSITSIPEIEWLLKK